MWYLCSNLFIHLFHAPLDEVITLIVGQDLLLLNPAQCPCPSPPASSSTIKTTTTLRHSSVPQSPTPRTLYPSTTISIFIRTFICIEPPTGTRTRMGRRMAKPQVRLTLTFNPFRVPRKFRGFFAFQFQVQLLVSLGLLCLACGQEYGSPYAATPSYRPVPRLVPLKVRENMETSEGRNVRVTTRLQPQYLATPSASPSSPQFPAPLSYAFVQQVGRTD